MILDSYEYIPVAQVTMQCMVKFTLEYATKAQRSSREITLLIL